MRRPWKRVNRRLDCMKRGLHKRPFPPPAFDTFLGKSHVGIVGQRRLNGPVRSCIGPRIKVDGDIVPDRCQAQSLSDDCVRVLVTQQYKGNICHSGLHLHIFNLVLLVISVFSD
jgi:hypothetical protein